MFYVQLIQLMQSISINSSKHCSSSKATRAAPFGGSYVMKWMHPSRLDLLFTLWLIRLKQTAISGPKMKLQKSLMLYLSKEIAAKRRACGPTMGGILSQKFDSHD